MNEELKNNTRHAIIFSSLGIILIVTGLVLAFISFVNQGHDTTPLSRQCIQELRSGNFLVEELGDVMNVKSQGVSQIEDNVIAASLIMSRCVGYKLESFCAGRECAHPGVEFKLSKVY